MRLVDTLRSYAQGAGTVEACLPADSIVAGPRGELDEVAFVELIAQGYATVKGYEDLLLGKPIQQGLLVGVRKLHLTGTAVAGERLLIGINTIGIFEGFSVVEGNVTANGNIIAAGTIKLWLVNDGATPGERP